MKNKFDRLWAWLGRSAMLMVVLAACQQASAKWTVRTQSGSIINGQPVVGKYIEGLSEKGFLRFYLTTDENFVTSLTAYLERSDDMVWTEVAYNPDVVVEGAVTPNLNSKKMRVGVSTPMKPVGALIEAKPNVEQLVLTAYYTFSNPPALAGSANAALFNVQDGWSKKTASDVTKYSVDDGSIEVIADPGTVVQRSFEIVANGMIQTDEDDAASPSSVMVDPNGAPFASKGWDNGQGAMVPVTSGVEFTSVKWKNDGATEGDCTDAYGELAVGADGRIAFTPRRYWYGKTDTVVATAKWSGSAETVQVEFQINVRPVVTPIDVMVSKNSGDFNWKENGQVHGVYSPSLRFDFADYDGGEWTSYNSALKWYDNDGSYGLAFKFPNVPAETATRVPIGDGDGRICVTEVSGDIIITGWERKEGVIGFDVVSHPNRVRSGKLSFEIGDGGDHGARLDVRAGAGDGYGAAVVAINDVDRLPSAPDALKYDNDINTIKAGETIIADSEVLGVDPDGDICLTLYRWYAKDKGDSSFGVPSSWSLVRERLAGVKGTTYYFEVIGMTKPYNDDETATSATRRIQTEVTVRNSEPVLAATSGNIFIQRNEGVAGERKGSFEIPFSDADGWQDVLLIASQENVVISTVAGEGGINGSATLELVGDGNNGRIRIEYTIPENFADTADATDTLAFRVGDKGDDNGIHAYADVTITVDYKQNPVPKVTWDAIAAVDEVDGDGNPASFDVTFEATDGQVFPAGVKAWEVVMPEGWPAAEPVGEAAVGSVSAGTWSGRATYRFTTIGYDTISGAPRPASGIFIAKVRVQDTFTGAWGEYPVEITVNDVDRKPEGTAEIAFESESVKYGDTVKVAGTSGVTDPDGDEVSYEYHWFYMTPDSGELVDASHVGDSFANDAVVIKGNKIVVKAKAVTTPYEEAASAVTADFLGSAQVEVGNTDPYISQVADGPVNDDPAAEVRYAIEVAQQDSVEPLVVGVKAVDPDVDAQRDSLSFSLDKTGWDESGHGTVTIDADTGVITVVLPKDYNNAASDAKPSVKVMVSDAQSAATNSAIISLSVSEKNLPPVVKVKDLYVLPADLGVAKEVTFDVDMGGKYESEQQITAATVEVIEGIDIFEVAPSAVAPTENAPSGNLQLTYTVKGDAPLGSSAKVKVTVTDNGTTNGVEDFKTSDEYVFSIFVGATPWYPIISFTCVDPAAHQEGHAVVLAADGVGEHELVIRSIDGETVTVKPADYARIGHPGYMPNAEVSAQFYVYTVKDGRGEQCADGVQIAIPDYDVPGEATAISDPVTADGDGIFTLPEINVPMAKEYKLEIVTGDGTVVLEQDGGFNPDGNGMIVPSIPAQEMQLTKAGQYKVVVTGINPKGEGEATMLGLVITVPNDNDEELAWPADGEFLPASGAILHNASVNFSWPSARGARSYDLVVFNPNGTVFKRLNGLTSLNAKVDLAMDENKPLVYSWYVQANGKDSTLSSGDRTLTLSKRTDGVVITGVRKHGDGILFSIDGQLDADARIVVEYQYYTMGGSQRWFNNEMVIAQVVPSTDSVSGGFLLESISDADDGGVAVVAENGVDYIAIRYTINGGKPTDWAIYQVDQQ